MKKRLVSLVLAMVMVLSLMASIHVFADNTITFTAGDGSVENPYQITTAAQLDAVRNNMSASYKLNNDIDLADWGNWTPIGDSEENAFSGVFDGNDKSIKNMNINIKSANDVSVGLFGFAENCTIKKLNMKNSNINIDALYVRAGGIVGSASASTLVTISNCTNSGNVSAIGSFAAFIGGIVGYADSNSEIYFQIINCENSGELSAATTTSDEAYTGTGGIAGTTIYSTITNCRNIGKVSATSNSGNVCAGGIMGFAYSVIISSCTNRETVTATANSDDTDGYAGGLIGYINGELTIESTCYYFGEKPIGEKSDSAEITGLENMVKITEFADGDGSAENPYQITTPKQLDAVRNDLTASYILINDIDLADWGNWTPIGESRDNSFSGIFNGNDKSIKNMTVNIESENEVYAGLFGYAEGCTIINLNMKKSHIYVESSTFAYVGGIVGYAYTDLYKLEISDCTNSGTVNVKALGYNPIYAGGIVGYAYSYGSLITIKNCTNSGKLNTSPDSQYVKFGGIAGYACSELAELQILDCANSGTVNATTDSHSSVGGIVADSYSYLSFQVKVSNCTNSGKVSATSLSDNESASAGGIWGSAYSESTVFNCKNSGEVSAKGDNADAGGIVGDAYSIMISDCSNSGEVSAIGYHANAGGIEGFVSAEITIKNCVNSGEVSATELSNSKKVYINAGGIVGCLDSDSTISNCKNSGNVSVTADSADTKVYVGGLVGYSHRTSTIIECTNSGEVGATANSGDTNVGGLVGYINELEGFFEGKFIIEQHCYYFGKKAIGGKSEFATITGLENAIQLTEIQDGEIAVDADFTDNTVDVTITKNSTDSNVMFDVICAVYNNGVFVGVQSKTVIVSGNGNNVTFTDIPDGMECKILAWDSLNEMKPVCETQNLSMN